MKGKLALMFPGSGSQYPGMIRKLHAQYPVVGETFEEASDLLGYDLVELCSRGSVVQINRLCHALPAVYVTGVAHYRVFRQLCGEEPAAMLGHSLGTYAALTCAGALSLEEGLRLVVLRSRLAERLNASTACAVTIIKNAQLDLVLELCAALAPDGGSLAPACINSRHEFMVAGLAEKVFAFEQLVLEKSPDAAILPLVGSAPFHTPLMETYREELSAALAGVDWRRPSCTVLSDTRVRPFGAPSDIVAGLSEQIACTVQWRACIEALPPLGIEILLELGPQSVLKNLALAIGHPGPVYAFDDVRDRRAVELNVGSRFASPAVEPAATIVPALYRAAHRFADRPAIHWDGGTMTYRELNLHSNRLARRLRALGVSADDIVAVCLERSPELLIALHAVMKTGAAYMPLHPDEPPARKEFLLADSGARQLITRRELLTGFSFAGTCVFVEETDPCSEAADLEVLPSFRDLVYLLYTSGSTGRPKGVALEHGALYNRLSWMQAAYPISDDDVLLQKTVFTFDVSVWELFWWALHGASVALLPSRREHDPRAVVRALEAHRVTVLHFVPSLLDLFLDYAEIGSVTERTHSLRRAFTSGEKLAADSVDRFYRLFHDRPEVELVNLYGPTEAAIDVTHHLCRREPPYVDVPIGREIDNVRLYVFDEEMREVSAGEIGELYIAGVCLARGYHNDPAQTACKFLLHPAVPGERVYKSGDLVRRDPASRELHFLGRCDSQIKLRGQRIELGEIEQQIRDCAGVREAVVVADAERRSDHYIYSAVALAAGVGPEVLWKHLKAQLPEYMQPARLLVVDDMPRLTNGKVDRKSLQQRLTAASVGTVDLRAAGGIG